MLYFSAALRGEHFSQQPNERSLGMFVSGKAIYRMAGDQVATTGRHLRESSVMRKTLCVLFVVLLLLAVGLAGLGFYRDWFHLGSESDSDAGQTEIRLTIDHNKITADVDHAKQWLRSKSKSKTETPSE